MKRPHVTINCAMTADGKIAQPSGEQLKISSEEDMKRVYQLRNESDAVLVGINTVLSDDPKLTVKEKYVKNPKQPVRIVLDSKCRTPIDALVVNDVAKTFIFTTKKTYKKYLDNVELITCDTNKEGFIDLEKMLEILSEKGIKKLMVEGGSTVIYKFLKEGFADNFYVYIGPMILGNKKAPNLINSENFEKIIHLKLVEAKKIGEGLLVHYRLL
jgi:2,5-diamino-6-(ribosylamino)-4(3H)-pyrimidinone 5'-phosphate reductase